MRDDFPEPFGPSIATCSPASMESVIPSSAIFCSRNTVTFRNSISGGIRLLHSRPLLQIETVARGEEIIRLTRLVNCDLARSDHLEAIALHDDSRPFIDADPQ